MLTGLHVLLTYQCTFECDHCFAWGSPRQSGTLTLAQIRQILDQAADLGSITQIYYEGGEPFLYYPILAQAVESAYQMGFEVGVVSNGYWAISLDDALEWLRPFAGRLVDLSISSDLYHYDEWMSRQANNAIAAAGMLEIPVGVISVAAPDDKATRSSLGTIPTSSEGEAASRIMYRGRAAKNLAEKAPKYPAKSFTICPYEDLRSPDRLHLDPLGNLHICQGISPGNLFEKPLSEIWAGYHPDQHPITDPLLQGGPAELARRYGITQFIEAADACHLCYLVRQELRDRFPDLLTPNQMYGVY